MEARAGRLEQLGGIRRFAYTEGPEAGNEIIQVRTGSGLAYEVLPGKGMDLSLTEFAGVPLSWQSTNGDVHPAYYRSEGLEWLRSASGGLLMTCGPINVGSPSEFRGASYGLHGRAHHTPARHICAEGEWLQDHYEMRISGIMEETFIFGHSLRWKRTLHSRLGENRIMLVDRVENIGFQICPHMMLYHFNFGFPLLTEETTVHFPGRSLTPRDVGTPMDGYDRWAKPDPDASERVYYHEVPQPAPSDADGMAEAVIRQPSFPLGVGGTRPLSVRLRWDARTLPNLVQWRMPGAGVHVLGLEPSNCAVSGLQHEADQGTLRYLAPGETVTYRLELVVEE